MSRRRNPAQPTPTNDALDWRGSEKQIAWAKSIRSRKLPQITAEFDRVKGELRTFMATPRPENGLYRAAHESAKLAAQWQLVFIEYTVPFIADAKWWIDVRDRPASEIVYIYGKSVKGIHLDKRFM